MEGLLPDLSTRSLSLRDKSSIISLSSTSTTSNHIVKHTQVNVNHIHNVVTGLGVLNKTRSENVLITSKNLHQHHLVHRTYYTHLVHQHYLNLHRLLMSQLTSI